MWLARFVRWLFGSRPMVDQSLSWGLAYRLKLRQSPYEPDLSHVRLGRHGFLVRKEGA